MSDILKSVFDFLYSFFEKFPDLVHSKYFWISLSVLSCVSALLIYFCP